MTPEGDPIERAAADLTTALRAWLRARREPPEAQAAALAYELAALVARHAASGPQAFALLDSWAATMKWQIRERGVGVEHP